MLAGTLQILFGILIGALLPYLLLSASSMFVALVAIAFLVPAVAILVVMILWMGPQANEVLALELIISGMLLVWLGFEVSTPARDSTAGPADASGEMADRQLK